MHKLFVLMVSYNSPLFFVLFCFVFTLCHTVFICSLTGCFEIISLQVHRFFSAWSCMLMIRLLVAFFIPFTLFCSNRISIWFLFVCVCVISIFLLNFSFYSCSVFPECRIEWSLLSFFKTTTLNFFWVSCNFPFLWAWLLENSFGSILRPWFFHVPWSPVLLSLYVKAESYPLFLTDSWDGGRSKNNFCHPS